MFKKQPHYYRADYGLEPKKSRTPILIAGFIITAITVGGLLVSFSNGGDDTAHSSQSTHDIAPETQAQKLDDSDSEPAKEVPTSRLLLDM